MLLHPFYILKAPPFIVIAWRATSTLLKMYPFILHAHTYKENHTGLEWHEGKWADDDTIFTLGWTIPVIGQGGKSRDSFFLLLCGRTTQWDSASINQGCHWLLQPLASVTADTSAQNSAWNCMAPTPPGPSAPLQSWTTSTPFRGLSHELWS